MYYVYVLLSEKDSKFYVGYTDDLRRRFHEHQLGKVVSTKHRRPLKLLCYEAYNYQEEAIKRERFLKSSDGRKDLRKRLTVTLKNS